ncbi:MAG: hypothetical protein RIQ94_1243 [Pseudomonadota bacterium]|jgi:hypothetical protein
MARSPRRPSQESLKVLFETTTIVPFDYESMIIKVVGGTNQNDNLDFNRMRFKGVPLNIDLDSVWADRDKLARDLYIKFIEKKEWSEAYSQKLYVILNSFMRFCDKNEISDPFTEYAFMKFKRSLKEKLANGTYNNGGARTTLASIKALFLLFDHPVETWLDNLSTFNSGNGENPTEGYSDNELKLLAVSLHRTFTGINKILLAPDIRESYFYSKPKDGKRIVLKKNNEHNKLICASLYLTAYFTGANPSELIRSTLPREIKYLKEGKRWFRIEGIKRRAKYKYVDFDIGIADYGRAFIEKYLTYLKTLDQGTEPLLFPWRKQDGTYGEMSHANLHDFAQWLQEQFSLVTDDKKPLKPIVSRFRASAADRLMGLTGDPVLTASVLGNTPNVIRRNYTRGNTQQNNKELQATVHVMEQSARNQGDIKLAKQITKEIMGIKVLPRDEFLSKYANISNTTETGVHCNEQGNTKSLAFTNKAREAGLLKDGESLACADFLACFFYDHHFLVEDVDDIWCLISFKECLKASVLEHLSVQHFKKNFEKVIERIESLLNFRIDPKIVTKAQQKIRDEGHHPLWPDEDAILDWVV